VITFITVAEKKLKAAQELSENFEVYIRMVIKTSNYMKTFVWLEEQSS